MKRAPLSQPARLARIGRAGAVAAGRSASGALRKVGASPAERAEIESATAEANALTLLEAMGDLRGLAAKLGQTLAQEGHGLPEAYVRRLAELRRSAPPMHGSLARIQFRQALGDWPEAYFERFEREPFAAASLGQVHRAWLADGTALAVKIQYPGIRRAVESDFRLLEQALGAATLAGHEAGRLRGAMGHLRQRILAETDYRDEAAQLAFFRSALDEQPEVLIPAVHAPLSGERVLTMEFVDGLPIEDWLETSPAQDQRDELGRRLLGLFFQQAFQLGRFHADPHPGNVLVLPGERVGLVDFGCVEALESDMAGEVLALYRIPIEDETALDRQYRRLGLYEADDPAADARRAALLALQRANVGRYHQDLAFDFGDPAPMRELAACLRTVAGLGVASGPLLLFERTQFGLYGLLQMLGARVNCMAVLEPLLAD
jgi:predicted unusual protein kinase regulating ubiquinone biosynthesis (AarF/ABC1/UbiB family)